MAAVSLVLVWCAAGVLGLLHANVGRGRGFAGVADWLFAALLGPFSFLISFLAGEMLDRAEDDPERRS
jgi:hypothetical protein